MDPYEPFCTPGTDEDGEEQEVYYCEEQNITMSKESTSPCAFQFKIREDQMKWSLMHSRRIKLEISLISKTKSDSCERRLQGEGESVDSGSDAAPVSAPDSVDENSPAGTEPATEDPDDRPGDGEEEAESNGSGEFGEVLVIASYNPQYWVYETARVHETISVEEGGDPEILTFKNTDTILVLTQTPGLYEIKYSVIREIPKPLNPDEFFYSQYITLLCGFTLMGIALVAFEGKTFLNFVKNH